MHPTSVTSRMTQRGDACSFMQNMKDTLIVSTIGAESLPFLASFGVLPASFLFFGFYHAMVRLYILFSLRMGSDGTDAVVK